MSITDQPWTRVVTPGSFTPSWRARPVKVFVTIQWQFERNQKWELSLTAVEGPTRNGNAVGGCGQAMSWADDPSFRPATGWTNEMVDQLIDYWRRWHLNAMRAGSPAQEAWLRDHPITAVYPESHYIKASQALTAAGLNPDPDFMHPTMVQMVPRIQGDPAEQVDVPRPLPYRYGSSWLYEEVPADVLRWLYELPEATSSHPWGDRRI